MLANLKRNRENLEINRRITFYCHCVVLCCTARIRLLMKRK